MKISRKLFTGVVLSSLVLAGCTSQITEKDQYSGFLPNYDGLQEVTTPSGDKALRWIAPGFNPNAYNTVVFNQLELYPAPKPDERVNMQTLQTLQSFTTTSVKDTLSHKYKVVPNEQSAPAGARVLIMHAAITGVTAANEGMKWYEVVPIAAVVGAASAATGHRDQNSELFIEADLVDAATGLPVVKAVRKVFGKTLENDSQAITADDFKAAIGKLTLDLQTMIK
jgi:hypothetical protein